MEIYGGETLAVRLGGTVHYWRVSLVDNNLVKFFEEDGSYRQMPLRQMQELMAAGLVKVQEQE